jgi:hypothetical protein
MHQAHHIKKIIFLLCLTLILFFGENKAIRAKKCVNRDAEAVLVNNDIPSANMEAIAQVKWPAIEQVIRTEIKAESFVQNFTIVEDVIQTKAGGVVKSHTVADQISNRDNVKVKIKACVEPSGAKESVSQLALNNSIAVFITARKPRRSGGKFEETNVLSENLIGKITEQNYTIVDVALIGKIEAREIENAMKSGNTITVRSMMHKFLSNLVIIGKVDYTISQKKEKTSVTGFPCPLIMSRCA